MDKAEDGRRVVKSADRALDLLEKIAREPAGISFVRLGRELSIPKSSLHGLLDVLIARDFVEANPQTRRYCLGVRSWEVGQAYQRHHSIVDEAVDVLERIVATVNETAQMARLVGAENVYLAKVDSSHPLRLQSRVGVRLPAYATGVGKTLLAQKSDAEVQALLAETAFEAFTPTTHTSLPALLAEIERTRRRGFGIDNEEYTAGVFCIAVPVYDTSGRAETAISVSVPVTRIGAETLGEVLNCLAEGSLQISARIGSRQVDARLHYLTRREVAQQAIDDLLGPGGAFAGRGGADRGTRTA